MRMTICSLVFLITILFWAPATALVRGFDKISAGITYKQASPDGKVILVMLVPWDDDLSLREKKEGDEIRAIRSKYNKSGAYKNDGSTTPLWTVDWYSKLVVFPSDGVSLVRLNGSPENHAGGLRKGKGKQLVDEDLRQEVVAFFSKGKLVKRYELKELTKDPSKLRRSVSHFGWLKDKNLVDNEKRLEIITEEGRRILFDMQSGNIISITNEPEGAAVPERSGELDHPGQ